MNWTTGAQLLADRLGTDPATERVQVAADAPALWHWCNVDPGDASTPSISAPGHDPSAVAEQL
jgi:hypothetical protein